MTGAELPNGWSLPRLDEIARVTSGKRLPKGRSVTPLATPHPYIRVTDMRMGKVDLSNIQYVPEDVAPTISRYTVDANDLYISCAGSLGIVGQVPDVLHGANLTENANRISAIQINPNYLLHVLMSEMIQRHIQNIQTVGAQPKLALGRIRSFEIPCPNDPKEQEAIAEALSDADALIEGLERLIAKKRLIKQGAMQDLLSAKRRLPGFSGEWVKRKLGDYGKCLRGVSYEGQADLSETDTSGTVRLLRANNVQNGQIVFSDMQFVNSARVGHHQLLQDGDMLICMANGSRALVGKSAKFSRPDEMEYTFGAFMGAFRMTSDACSGRYIAHLLQSDRYRRILGVILSGSAINNLAPSQIENFEFSFAVNKLEQEAIADVLDDLDAEIHALEVRLAKARQVKEGMMQNLLTGRVRLV